MFMFSVDVPSSCSIFVQVVQAIFIDDHVDMYDVQVQLAVMKWKSPQLKCFECTINQSSSLLMGLVQHTF